MMSGIWVMIHACHGAYHTKGPRAAMARHCGAGFSAYDFEFGSKSDSMGGRVLALADMVDPR